MIITGQGQVIGNDRPASEDRPITAVNEIDLSGAFELTILVGQAPQLSIAGEENILAIIRTTVSGGRLDISSDRSFTANQAIKITVGTPHLARLTASGSNRIEGRNIDGSEFSVSLSGSNSATLAGEVAALTAHLDGSSRLSAARLSAASVNIRLAGSGDASVDAREHIVAQIFGSGSIVVDGDPKDRQSQVAGSGRITFSP